MLYEDEMREAKKEYEHDYKMYTDFDYFLDYVATNSFVEELNKAKELCKQYDYKLKNVLEAL